MNDSMQLLQVMMNLPLMALVLARISGLVLLAPFFSSSVIPAKTRIFFSLAITVVILPFTMSSLPVPGDLGQLVVTLIGEFLIGLTFGTMLNAVFSGLELAGVMIGQQMGIGVAEVFNPLFEEESSVFGQLYFWLAMVIFLLIQGHHAMLGAMIKSFQTLPPGKFAVDDHILAGLVTVLHLAFVLALQISIPILVTIFLTTLATGFVARTVPQLNILSIGFNLRVLLGFLILIICLAPTLNIFRITLGRAFETLYQVLGLLK